MRLNLIYARARNGVIGRNNTLPWHLPEDLAHFKAHTLGCPVIMGRRTWESLPPRFRPLPGRVNVVLSRDPHWSVEPGTVISTTASANPSAPQTKASASEGLATASGHENTIKNSSLHFQSLHSALSSLHDHPEVWVIGGAQIYAQALPLAQRVVVTDIDADFEGDAHAPTLGGEWAESAREQHTSANGLRFSFITYLRSTQKEI